MICGGLNACGDSTPLPPPMVPVVGGGLNALLWSLWCSPASLGLFWAELNLLRVWETIPWRGGEPWVAGLTHIYA